jgi:MscS family membrane protein
VAGSVAILVLLVTTVAAQGPGPTDRAASSVQASVPEPPTDTLGRTTPRGTVLGFLGAARRGENDLARQYLNTRLPAERAAELAQQLFVVLDTRLPALPELSDAPEGSGTGPGTRGLEIIGTIPSADGNLDIVLEQQPRAGETIWLFSSRTLQSIPAVYQEIALARTTFLPAALTSIRVGGIRLVEWVVMLIALAVLYPATVVLNRVLTALVRGIRRQALDASSFAKRGVVPAPARLLLLALLSRALLSLLPFSLLSRQLWSAIAGLVTIFSVAWLLMLIGGEVEHSAQRRIPATNAAATSLMRLLRRCFDVLVIFVALIATLRLFDIDPTPALAGLGVGGIAVALAAQKTLENVIAGASLIFDEAVKVGDFLRMGETIGTVEYIGLRSTRIRTLDRTLVSVPNSQIASITLETLSARDMYWFHPIVSLRYETTPEQLQTVVKGIHHLLSQHVAIHPSTLRVRFLRLGSFSLDVEVFAYVLARDWNHFLEIQEQLLFNLTAIVEQAGASMAFPSQTVYVAGQGTAASDESSLLARESR